MNPDIVVQRLTHDDFSGLSIPIPMNFDFDFDMIGLHGKFIYIFIKNVRK